MEEQLISFETAKLAKEKGFDIETGQLPYMLNGDNIGRMGCCFSCTSSAKCSTQSLLQKYLREVHNIIIVIQLDQTTYPKYCFNVYKYKDFGNWEEINNPDWGLYSKYEGALEDGLQLALKSI